MSLTLTGKQVGGLKRALVGAFPTEGELTELAYSGMNLHLGAIPKRGADQYYNLASWASTSGKVEELISAAVEQSPDSPSLRAFVAELALSPNQALAPGGKLEHHFEAVVLGSVGFQDPAVSRRRQFQAEVATCLVEDSKGRGKGTGVLVGEDVIMTNEHVADKLRKVGGTPRARFGYIKSEEGPGAASGVVVSMAADGWELVSSPPEGLDFSLLRLAEPAAAQPIGGSQRGFLEPQAGHDFTKDEPIVILQHPQEEPGKAQEPLKLGVGFLTDVNNFTKRIAYTTNTEPGSSGSPCFTLGWDLVALHHHGDKFTNHGTPMKYILEYLKAQGKASLIG